ncbi:MAG: hypothetical protein V4671_32750 [Armatimonadota bacterium]
MIRRSVSTVPTSVTVALTVLGTVVGMKISAVTQMGQPSLQTPSTPSIHVHGSRSVKVRTASQQASTSASDASDFYPVTLIGQDGSHTSLKGRSLLVDMGNQRILEIRLQRLKEGYLNMWAPARREDKYFHWTVFRPGCANSFYLELERVDDPDGADGADQSSSFESSQSKASVLYEEPKPLP